MKLFKDYTKEPYSFLVNDMTLSLDNPLRFRKNLKQSITKSIKIKVNIVYTEKLLRFLFYNQKVFFTGKYVLPEKDLLEKAAALKRFEYSPFGKELKAQTGVAKDQYMFYKGQIENVINKKEKKMKEILLKSLI